MGSFDNFPTPLYCQVIETGTTDLATLTLDHNLELKYLRIFFFVYGTRGGSESLVINFYSANNTLLFSSSSVVLSTITGIGAYWLGFLRFDFARQSLKANTTYTLKTVTTSYTRNANTFYLATMLDYPNPINTQGGTGTVTFGPHIEVYGYRRLQDEF